uniref:Peptidase n=1 Tax=Thermosporothrix sp. COM3 TaxID=2490863 RepID=A0A455SF61_9CHLR|nr:peptidase [Thermosporothrix sp. COM3]
MEMARPVSRRLLHLFLLGFLVCALSMVGSEAASAAKAPKEAPKETSQRLIPDHESRNALQYWTEERFRSAVPKDVERQAPRQIIKQPGKGEPKPQASAVPVGAYDSYPYSTIGKVFFTDPVSKTDYVCSGTSLSSRNGSIVDTAGHCVIEGGSGNNFYVNWVFCPQYLDGYCPRGVWPARQLHTTGQWANNADFSRDIGFAVVATNNGMTLNQAVGGVRLATDLPAEQNFRALGYPQEPPFTGQRMYQCTSPATVRDTNGSPQPIGINCDMTGGSSGGGWLIRGRGSWYLNGHTSYVYTNLPDVLFSPYYDGFVGYIFNQIQG